MRSERDVKTRITDIFSKASENHFLKVINGLTVSNDVKRLEFTVLGVNYALEVVEGEVKVSVSDPLGREEDSSRLIVYMLNAVERVLEGKTSCGKGGLIKFAQLEGGSTAQLYEKRIANYLAAEMDGSNLPEIEGAVKLIGGYMVEHPNATWSFEVSPFCGVRFRVAYWQGEEDMPSNAALFLGGEAKEAAVPVDELIVIAEMAVNRFVLFYRKIAGKKPKLFESLYL
ncbi:MAG: DUF3786 domain-containing protein [Candidatus Bathyarchaeia archaeon]